MQSGSPQPGARRSHRQPRGPVGPLKPEQVAKLLSELDVVRRNIDIMSEIMTETEPGKETTEDVELLDVSGEEGGGAYCAVCKVHKGYRYFTALLHPLPTHTHTGVESCTAQHADQSG